MYIFPVTVNFKFQFLIGRLGTAEDAALATGLMAFQFLIGRLGTGRKGLGSCSLAFVSIPYR